MQSLMSRPERLQSLCAGDCQRLPKAVPAPMRSVTIWDSAKFNMTWPHRGQLNRHLSSSIIRSVIF